MSNKTDNSYFDNLSEVSMKKDKFGNRWIKYDELLSAISSQIKLAERCQALHENKDYYEGYMNGLYPIIQTALLKQ